MAFKFSKTLKFLEFQEPFFKKVLGVSRGRASHNSCVILLWNIFCPDEYASNRKKKGNIFCTYCKKGVFLI